jgi:hypothetical protein
VSLLLVVAGLITLVARGLRRRPAPGLPPVVTRRVSVLVGAAAALLAVAGTANDLPIAFAGWDTATPWTSFLATLGLGAVVGAAVTGLAAGALWTVVDALRRRAGVPFWPRGTPDGSPGRDARDAVLLGAALGIAPAALGALFPLARAVAWPEGPATALDRVVPWAAPALGAAGTVLAAAALALPAAALVAGLRGARARLVALAGAAVLVSAAAAPDGVGVVLAAAGGLGGAGLAALTAWAFGRGSAVPWIAAPLAARAVTDVGAARAAANASDAAGALLGAAVAVGLLALVYRVAVRAVRLAGSRRGAAAVGGGGRPRRR